MALNEYSPLKRVALRHAREALRGRAAIEREWRTLGYPEAPDFEQAVAESERFAEILAEAGAELVLLDGAEGLTIDSIYVRDASLVAPGGTILCNPGKAARVPEAAAAGRLLAAAGETVLGGIEGAGLIEGGDLVWFDERTCAVALCYRTNAEGIAQLRALLGPEVEVIAVPLPHYKGPGDVFHLMSILSPLDRDLALVYSPLMPVPFRQWLLERGMTLVEVPDEEFETMGCNVLALGPRQCLMLEGNPQTRRRLEAAGCAVRTYEGNETSLKGAGGPTCLTRPLARG
jgi:N-dimethylarginine dimethylaminohydrolase